MVSLHVGTLYDGNTVRVSSHVRYTFRYSRSKGLFTRMVLLAMVKQHWSPHVYGARHDGDTVMVARCDTVPVLGHAHIARCTLR